MWIEPYKNKYRAVERYTDPLTGKTKRVSTIINKDTKASRKAAESVLDGKIKDALARKVNDDITLKELSEKYIADQERTIKASSMLSTKSHLKYVLDMLDPDSIVSRLTAGYVYEQIVKKSATPYMVNRNILYFKAMINWAYAHDYVADKTWLDKIKRVKMSKPISKVEDYYLEASELKTLIDAIPQYHWKLLTQFLALSGLRIGEAMALMDTDVDTYIHVTKTYHSSSKTLSNSAKTENSNRDVFIQPELQAVIRKIRAYQKEIMMATGSRSGIFFPMADGNIISYDAYQKRLKKYALESLGRPVVPHMLRHTHVSLLAEQGIPLETISRRLGHHDSKITEEVYLHVTEKKKKNEEALLSGIKIL